jgi:hypothetical protein
MSFNPNNNRNFNKYGNANMNEIKIEEVPDDFENLDQMKAMPESRNKKESS